ncbi:MAG: beta-galactosidase, partial [Bacteroides sp.]|nr:beta-galactosidase [Bacteroides sp.]
MLLLFPLTAQRTCFPINDNWLFRFSHQVEKNTWQRVDIPHTWNTTDALAGKPDYKRGVGNYKRKLFMKEEWRDKRLFLRFEVVGNIANVFMNGKHLGE